MLIAVFASSSMTKYADEVRRIGRILGKDGHMLVFGGCDNGLMHEIAEGFAEAKADMTGVVPSGFSGRRLHPACNKIIFTEGLSDRKEKMIELSDAFLVVPGGIGTMDELFTVLAEKSVGAIKKPILVYNPDGFYNSLLSLLEEMERSGAIHDAESAVLRCFSKPEKVLEALNHG